MDWHTLAAHRDMGRHTLGTHTEVRAGKRRWSQTLGWHSRLTGWHTMSWHTELWTGTRWDGIAHLPAGIQYPGIQSYGRTHVGLAHELGTGTLVAHGATSGHAIGLHIRSHNLARAVVANGSYGLQNVGLAHGGHRPLRCTSAHYVLPMTLQIRRVRCIS